MDYRFFCNVIAVIGIIANIGLLVLGSDDMVAVDVENNKDILDSLSAEYQIVYPQQIRMNEVLNDLSTRDKTSKSKHTNIELVLSGRRQKMKLELNRSLLGESLIVETSIDSTRQYREEIQVENCYYQGQIRKLVDTRVMVSTCNGIRGVILHRGRVVYIQPLRVRQHKNETLFPHVLFEASQTIHEHCGNSRGLWSSYVNLHHAQYLRNVKISKQQEVNLFDTIKPLKMGFVIDHSLFKRLNGTVTDTLSYTLLLANVMDGLLKDLRLRLRLEYVEVWNDRDLMSAQTNPRASLTSFLQYRSKMSAVSFNYIHLLTGVKYDNNEFGMAVQDSICSERSLAVSQIIHFQHQKGQVTGIDSEFYPLTTKEKKMPIKQYNEIYSLVAEERDLLRVAVSVTHLLGHILGIEHDTHEECTCEDNGRCVMKQNQGELFDTHAAQWSSCSVKNWNKVELSLLDECLYDETLTKPEGPANIMSYEQKCGNGVTERGEECDCVNKECTLVDPCCDQDTCLLKTWSTCRSGDCCKNCTLQPSNQMCRYADGECDVPEFCDGKTGNCPVDGLIQDGHQCPVTTDGLCYRGVCQTYNEQCRTIWGPDAMAADDRCYEMFNTAGRFDGHCGVNATSGELLKCAPSDIKCGLLHCTNGTDKPILAQNWTFSLTHVGNHGANYQCKVLLSDSSHPDLSRASLYDPASVAMVSDGSRCGLNSVCFNGQCEDVSRIMPGSCPRGPNGLICSKRGVCTTQLTCFCQAGYGGIDCSQASNWTYIPLITTTLFPPRPSPTPPRITTPPPVPDNITTEAIVTTSTSLLSIQSTKKANSSTVWLLTIMGSVVVGASILLAIVVLCCRRQAPSSRRKKYHTGIEQSHSLKSLNSRKSSDANNAKSSTISFNPKLPSYREYKRKKAQRVVSASETESEHSRGAGGGDRSSGEIKSAPPSLNKNPEKGILKNRSNGKRKSRDLSKMGEAQQTVAQIERESTSVGSENVAPTINEPTTVEMIGETSAVDPSTERLIASLDELDDSSDDSSSCCSCDDDTNASESDVRRSSGLESIEEEVTRPHPSVTQEAELKMALLQDLQDQLDSQYLLQTDQLNTERPGRYEVGKRQRSQSPVHSDDRSETEADRCLAPDSFYKQSDSLGRDTSGLGRPRMATSQPSPLIRDTRSYSSRAGSTTPKSSELQRRKFFESPSAVHTPSTTNVFSPIQRLGESSDSRYSKDSNNFRGPGSSIPAPQPRRAVIEGRYGPPLNQSTPLPSSSGNPASISNRAAATSPTSAKSLSLSQPSVPYQSHHTDKSSRTSQPLEKPTPGILSVFSRPTKDDTMRTSTTSSKGSRGSDEGSVVVREIPKNRSFDMRFVPDARGAYTKAPGSPGSPEDIDV